MCHQSQRKLNKNDVLRILEMLSRNLEHISNVAEYALSQVGTVCIACDFGEGEIAWVSAYLKDVVDKLMEYIKEDKVDLR